MTKHESAAPAAHLEMSRSSAAPGETVRFTLVNNDTRPLMTGAAYTLDRLVDGRWAPVDLKFAFTADGHVVKPGHRHEMGLRLPPHIPAGHYRVGKRVHPRVSTGVQAPSTLTAELDVSGPPQGGTRAA